MINTLCDTALLCAFADDKSVINAADIRSATEELGWEEHHSTTGRYRDIKELTAPPIEKVYQSKIIVRSDGEEELAYEFCAGRVIVGRSPDNEIFINSKFVSRHHAQLTTDDNGCTIQDLNSTNGIYVNDQRVKKYRMKDGDILSLGIHELVYTDLRRSVGESLTASAADDTGDIGNSD